MQVPGTPPLGLSGEFPQPSPVLFCRPCSLYGENFSFSYPCRSGKEGASFDRRVGPWVGGAKVHLLASNPRNRILCEISGEETRSLITRYLLINDLAGDRIRLTWLAERDYRPNSFPQLKYSERLELRKWRSKKVVSCILALLRHVLKSSSREREELRGGSTVPKTLLRWKQECRVQISANGQVIRPGFLTLGAWILFTELWLRSITLPNSIL